MKCYFFVQRSLAFLLLAIVVSVFWSCRSTETDQLGVSSNSNRSANSSSTFTVQISGADNRVLTQDNSRVMVVYDLAGPSPSIYFREMIQEGEEMSLYQIQLATTVTEPGEYEFDSDGLPSGLYSIIISSDDEGWMDGSDMFQREISGRYSISNRRGDRVDGRLSFVARNSEGDEVRIEGEFSGVSLQR